MTSDRLRAFVLLLALPFLCAATAQRPTTVIDQANCVTSECHVDVKSSAVVHGPVSADTCDACHELIEASAHTYKLNREKAELCTYCHEFDVSAMPVIHKPVKTGECLGCHDPHGGRDRTITREKSMAEMCGRCHQSVTANHKFLHGPVSKGQCDSCHPPHAAMFPRLLDAQGSDLCLACHVEFDQKLAAAKFRHKAMDKGCQECHDAHGSDQPMQVTKSTVELCEGCHEKVKNDIAAAEFKHSVVTKDRACLTCHTAHGGDSVRLMLDQPARLCMTCHKDPIKLDKTHVIPAVTELADTAMHKHGAIKDGQCGGCHNAHGSDQPELLTKVYSRTLYQPFAAENYQLCFGCHDVRLVQQEKTTTMTAFRDGDRNLHWVHVREGQLGRACVICHTTHASPNARNIRQTAPYKVWNMPIRFNKTETGGSCAPGCHVPGVYDRDHPAKEPAAPPAIPVAPAVARSEHDQPVLVSLEATDVAGQPVSVPDPEKPTVILFFSAEQSGDERIIKSIVEATSAPRRARVIVILCGPSPAIEPSPQAPDWPIIADPDGKLANQLAVHGWPTALVIQSDGLQVARIGGAAESFSFKLAPYVDVAEKRLDRVIVEDQLAARPQLVSDGPERLPTRQLQAARKLLDDGDPREAQRILAEALVAQPNSVPLKLAMAQALIALDRWDDARVLLVGLLEKAPQTPEAHSLLGKVYEHTGNAQAALAEYRAAASSAR